MPDSDKDSWISRVLGVALPHEAVDLAAASAAWQQASEAVDAQISALQQALLQSDDVELQEIAEFGLNGVTGNFRVPLMAALRDAQGGNARAIAALPRIAAAFRAYLDSEERVAVCDQNPFGVSVSIRATLGPALEALSRVAA